jgi:type I restriction enzyme S subunit
MSERLHPTPLGEFIRQRKESILLEDGLEYRRVTTRLRGRGVVERDVVKGTEIKTKKQFPIRSGDLLVAEIDAKVGGYGIVPPELEGAVVSSHYFLFEVDQSRCDLRYLAYWLQTPGPLDQLKTAVQGATNYAAIRPYHVPQLTIPLPDPPEQRRIVQLLDAVAARVREVQRLHEKLDRERDELLFSLVDDMKQRATWEPLHKVAPITRRPVTVEAGKEYPELGIRSFGKGTFHKPPVPAEEVGTKRLFWIKPGDLMFSNVFAWEAAIAVAKREDEGRCGSHRFISCLCDSDRISAEFLCTYFLTNEGLAKIRAASPGAAGRNKTLGVGKLEAIMVPVPERRDLETFNRVYRHTMEARRQQGLIAQELETLLPATLDMAFRGEL